MHPVRRAWRTKTTQRSSTNHHSIIVTRMEPPSSSSSDRVGNVNLDDVLNLDDLEAAANRVMAKQDYDYYAGWGERASQ